MWAYIGYGSISTAWMTLNIVVADPIPRARARMASKANAGCLRRPRAAYRTSCHAEGMRIRRRGWPGSLHRSALFPFWPKSIVQRPSNEEIGMLPELGLENAYTGKRRARDDRGKREKRCEACAWNLGGRAPPCAPGPRSR